MTEKEEEQKCWWCEKPIEGKPVDYWMNSERRPLCSDACHRELQELSE